MRLRNLQWKIWKDVLFERDWGVRQLNPDLKKLKLKLKIGMRRKKKKNYEETAI